MKITNRQIINTIEKYSLYQTKMKSDTERLKRLLFYNGNSETEEVKKLRKQIKSDSESLSKFLDEVI